GPARAGRIERLLAGGQSGAVAELGSGGAAELSFGRLRLFRGDRHLTWEPLVVSGGTGRKSAGGWRIGWSSEPAPVRLERMGSTNWFAPGKYLVRPWRPGDRIRPLGGVGRRLVVRCMQDAKIASGRRASWPVVEKDGTVVWVPGVSRSAEVVPAPGTRALRIDAAHR
ncbi:MAG: tRNA lysidine(34) synthetase TilS, partial [Gemmatimonadales bacterium]|nr:tRNA lysidine(34) synthetase TilS [Gemmatimonadales bacterium]